jgi:hypothetical protein
MLTEKSTRRMPLRQLLTHSEKCSRDLAEHIKTGLIHILLEYRELTRPVRRRSSYPTLLMLRNALRKVEQAREEARQMVEYLHERLEEIKSHSKRA